ncbi:uncharacterized protein [Dendrobates tinctorius]|uniref:uncharacterized protein n=1 Tax=Dendrobates tinctorius TaxID=92724 RepID=UPI003CCA08BC
MASQPTEIVDYPKSDSNIPGNVIRHLQGPGAPSQGQDTGHPSGSSYTPSQSSSISPVCHESPRPDGSSNRGSAICPVSPQGPSTSHTQLLGQESLLPRQGVQVDVVNQEVPALVAQSNLAYTRKALSLRTMEDPDYRCKPDRLGGSAPTSQGTRQVVTEGSDIAHQYSGNQGHPLGTESLSSLACSLAHTDTVGQCHGCGIREPPRRDPQRPGDERSGTYPPLGGKHEVGTFCGPHSGCRKLGSLLPQQARNGLGGVVSPSRDFLPDLSMLGNPGGGPNGIPSQYQGPQFHGQDTRPAVARSGCPGPGLVPVPTPVHFSTPPPNLQGREEDQARGSSNHPHRSRLAQTYMVRRHRSTYSRRPLASSRPSVSRSVLPSEFRGSQFDGMALETWILTQAGFSPAVIATMIRARKPASAKIYYRTWRAFFSWCESHGQVQLPYSLPKVLGFLQSGLDDKLSLGSLNSQVSALSVLFQKCIATKPQVRTFIQGVSRLVPPYKRPLDTWDLNLVLTALQAPPFEPLRGVPLSILSQKVVFLVAITSLRRVSELSALSCRRPFLAFHQDKVVLRTVPSFLPKVVSNFHLNEEISLPSLCPVPVHRVEKALHTLDLVRALRIYVSRTAPFRKSDSLFILPEGSRKGLPASKATLARWIKSTIHETY